MKYCSFPLVLMLLALICTSAAAQESLSPEEAEEKINTEFREFRNSIPKDTVLSEEEYYENRARIAKKYIDAIAIEEISREEKLRYAKLLTWANMNGEALKVYEEIAAGNEDQLAKEAQKGRLSIRIDMQNASLEQIRADLNTLRKKYPPTLEDSWGFYSQIRSLAEKAAEEDPELALEIINEHLNSLDINVPTMSWRIVLSSLDYYEQTGNREKGIEELEKYAGIFAEKAKAYAEAEEDEQKLQMYNSLVRMLENKLTRETLIGNPAPPIEFTHFWNTDPITWADLRGSVVVLDFWATWCGPCIATFPQLRQFYADYKDKNVVVIGVTGFQGSMSNHGGERLRDISEERELELMPQFIEHQNVTWPLAFSTRGAGDSEYGISGIPTAVIIDQQGIVKLMTHPMHKDEIIETVEALLAKEKGSN